MELNPRISEILREFNIDKSEGLLVLLGIYHKLNIDKVYSEETVKAINLTKIVVKDYGSNTIVWNEPLYKGENTDWAWIKEWNDRWKANIDRKDSLPDVTKRMQEFFKKYPKYRIQDVQKATDIYFAATDVRYLKSSARFIFDGAGAMKKSMLLTYCERLIITEPTNIKGKIIT